ncbi:tetratricopeptide repeat protein [Humisphaera borealis]|uniref:Tetratricopeptide repeat protein n=1 Tax=Humisphaera borealis TaxID=2807512 RepID=A0A7M2WY09_9BACT|nr:tetratricopeptide repeat protein [Humisphaera borealis]QOV90417.1 tetratricopeptide repeat protein [Humisphaera borealis]
MLDQRKRLPTLVCLSFVRRNLLRRAAVAAVAVACLAVPAWSDVIRLKDGTSYEGEIKRSADGWEVVLPGGKKLVIPTDKVKALEAKPKPGATVPDERLASLRRAAEAMPDIKQVIERYRGFIVQFAGSPAADAAKADLVIWQDRLDRKLTKVGDVWMTDAEREATAEKSYQTAEQALTLLLQGRTNQGMPLLEQSLVENPKNAAAWYMKGILLFKQDKAVEARKAFETASSLVPDHAATYNNLAVVLWRQNQHVAALLNYEKALLAAPLHRGVLDNMAEALAALPVELRDGNHVKRIVRHFNDQDSLLQQQMAVQSLYRWGSTWVSQADIAQLQALEREVRAKIDQMELEYNAISARQKRLEVDIASAQNTIRQMEANSVGLDANGRMVRYPLPPSYYEFVRDLAVLKAERDQRMAEQEQMRQQARKLQQTIPTPKYTGAQRLIEWEGTPIFGKAGALPVADAPPVANRPPEARPAPATAPATMPASPPATQPRKPIVPFEKPSIMDRRFAEPPPPTVPDRPLLDGQK